MNSHYGNIQIQDALRAQPKLAEEPGYKAWLADEDENCEMLNEALAKWGMGSMDEDGEIE